MNGVSDKKEKKVALFLRVPIPHKGMVKDLKKALPPIEQRPKAGKKQYRAPSGSEVVTVAIEDLHKKHFGKKKK